MPKKLPSKPKPKAYALAGVDIDLGNKVKSSLPQLLAATHRPEVLGKVGGFGGLFALDVQKYKHPVLVSSVDGVGTKLKLAFAMDRHDTIGQDLVNHCVNDIAVLGAAPLFFLDYLGTGKLQPRVFSQILKGFAKACAENGCALIGGETAQMPGFYRNGEYDLSGTIVGVVERSRILDGRAIQPGDAVIGLASSGLHTNGYSLARKVLFEKLRFTPNSYLPELRGSIGAELLKVHLSYGPLFQKLLKTFNPQSPTPGRAESSQRGGSNRARAGRDSFERPAILGAAHITGGGFVDNIPRVLPEKCDALIRQNSWPVPPIFELLRAKGKIPEPELYQVFNMGIGMVLIVSPKKAQNVLSFIGRHTHRAWQIGEVVQGNRTVRFA